MDKTIFGCRRYFVFLLVAFILGLAESATTLACKMKSPGPSQKSEGVRSQKTRGPSEAKAGSKSAIACMIRDGQNIYDLKLPIRVTLTSTVNPKDFSYKIEPDPGGWTEHWSAEGRSVLLTHTGLFQAGARYQLELKLKSPAEKLSIRFRAFGASSLDLIEKDARAGLLDLDTLWAYKLQSLFDPKTLPAKYKSPTPIPCGRKILSELRKVRTRLKPETLAACEPYLVRPTNPKSAFSKRIQMSRAHSLANRPGGPGLLFAAEPQRPTGQAPNLDWCPPKKNGNISVHVPNMEGGLFGHKDACQYANVILRALESYSMWERFQSLLGQTPPSDADDADNGGDGTLDIYVVPPSPDFDFDSQEDSGTYYRGWCMPTGGGSISPSYIIIDCTQESDEVDATLAHELFHSFQFAFDVDEEDWWVEGSAVWAENFINPGWNFEHEYDQDAFDADEHRLKPLRSEEGLHEYAAYLFPFLLAGQGGENFVSGVWQSCPGQGALKAVTSVLGGDDGFKESFKKFAYANFNQLVAEKEDKYPEEIDVKSLHDNYFELSIPKKLPFEKTINLPALSAVYYFFRNEVQDRDGLPHVTFDLRKFKDNPKLSVQAYVEYRGKDPQKEDWTGQEKKEFCLNNEEEDFVNVFLILGNSEPEKEEQPTLKVTIDQEGCGLSYADITRKDHYFSHDWGENYDSTSTRDEEITVRVLFDNPQISANMGKVGEEKGMPYGFTLIQGQTPGLVSHKFKRHSVTTDRDGTKTHDASGSTPRVEMPDVPTITRTYEDKTQISLKPYPVIIMFYEAMTGKVRYVLLPDFAFKFKWDDQGKDRTFDVKPLAQGDSAEKVDMPGVTIGRMRVRKVHEVKSGDGVKTMGGDGRYKHENRKRSSYELQEKSYKWEVHVRPQKKK
jgi:hypothetical protein